jgi:diketogulonate reductase-like aldo/keto reductase
LGQGSWHLGQGRHPAAEEEDALRTGLSLGMTLIDTSGNYGEGRSEELIKGVIAGQRDRAFVVSKVEADQVTGNAMARACDGSLARLGTDYLDLYLLHSPVPNTEFSDVVAGFESLHAAGKIRSWGVAWTIRSGNVIAIPESGSPAHVKENAVALSLTLTPQELQTLDAAHPPPGH